MILLVVFIFVLPFVSSANINTCQALTAGSYTLTADVFSSINGNCFTDSGNGVTLDCDGYTIVKNGSTTSASYGITFDNANQVVTDCKFMNWTGSTWPMFVRGGYHNYTNIEINSSNTNPRWHNNGNNQILNNFTCGADIDLTPYGTNSNFTIVNSTCGLSLVSTSTNFNINNHIVTNGQRFVLDGSNIVVNNSFINGTNDEGDLGSYINISNTIIENTNYRIYLEEGTETNIIFDNVTFRNLFLDTFSFAWKSLANSTFKNCSFYNVKLIQGFLGDSYYANDNLNILQNYFENTTFRTSATNGMGGNNILAYYNILNNSELGILRTNNSIIMNNTLQGNDSLLYFGGGANHRNYNVTFFNNYANDIDEHTFDIEYSDWFRVYDNNVYDADYCFVIEEASHGLFYNNSCLEQNDGDSYFCSHGFLLGTGSKNVTAFNNTAIGCQWLYLFEYNVRESVIRDNYMEGGTLYSLHDDRNNIAYNNKFNGGTIRFLDNESDSYYHDFEILGAVDLWFDGFDYARSGLGVWNITIANMHGLDDITIEDNSTDINLINVTWTGTESVDVNSSYKRKWYLDASANVDGVNISVTNSTGGVEYSNLTGDSGTFEQLILTDYQNYEGDKTYYSNYTVTATKSGYTSQTQSINLTNTNNTILSFTFTASLSVSAAADSSTNRADGLPSYNVPSTNLQEGTSLSVGKNWIVNLNVNNQNHEMNIDDIGDDYVKFTLSSEPRTFKIYINETKKIDLDGDNFYDLIIRVDRISGVRYKSADLYLKEIHEEIPVEGRKDQEIIGVDEKRSFSIFVLLGLIVIILTIFILFRRNVVKSKK